MNSCTSDTFCDSITIICPLPFANFGYSDSSLIVSFSDSSTNAISWFWDFGDGATDTIQNPTHPYSNAGNYTVTLIVSNACGSDTVMQSVPVNLLGISEPTFSKFSLYPNPNNGNFQINYQLSKGQKGKLIIFDITGKKLFAYRLENEMNYLKISNESVLKNGLYFYQIIINNNIIVRHKLIIIK